MPLPVPIHYVDQTTRDQKTVAVRPGKDSGYRPDPDYHPTMKPVRCGTCGAISVCEFVNGFNLRDGDALMAGRTIRGICFGCKRETDLVPISRFLRDGEEKEIVQLYKIAQALDYAAKQGYAVTPDALIFPVAKMKEYEKRFAAEREGMEWDGKEWRPKP